MIIIAVADMFDRNVIDIAANHLHNQLNINVQYIENTCFIDRK